MAPHELVQGLLHHRPMWFETITLPLITLFVFFFFFNYIFYVCSALGVETADCKKSVTVFFPTISSRINESSKIGSKIDLRISNFHSLLVIKYFNQCRVYQTKDTVKKFIFKKSNLLPAVNTVTILPLFGVTHCWQLSEETTSSRLAPTC